MYDVTDEERAEHLEEADTKGERKIRPGRISTEELMNLPRKERQRLGKIVGIKIPGKQDSHLVKQAKARDE